MTSERLAPDAILAQTNLTGAVTDIDDDPDSPDAAWLAASGNNVNTDVRVSFPSPAGNPTVGADLQEFRARVRQFDTGQTGIPDARVELWENGALVRAGPDTIIGAGGAVLSFSWNANELATADGSLVECRVVGTKSGGSPSARNSVEVGAVEWNAEYTAAGSAFTIGGAVTLATQVAAALAVNRHTALSGAVTLAPASAALLDFTLNTALAGALGVSVVAAADLSHARHSSLPGSVAVAPVIGAAMAFQSGAAIAGVVVVVPAVTAALARNVHPALAGSLALGSTVAAAMTHAPSGGAIAGLVIVTPGVAGILARNRHRLLAGGSSLALLPAAGLAFGGPVAVVGRSALSGEVRRSEMAGASGPITLTGKVA